MIAWASNRLATARSLLSACRVPIVICALFYLGLLYTGQFRDIYRAYALEPLRYLPQVAFILLALALFSYLLVSVVSRSLAQGETGRRLANRALLPVGFACIPVCMLGLGLIQAGREIPATGAPYVRGLIALQVVGAVVMAVAIVLFAWLATGPRHARVSERLDRTLGTSLNSAIAGSIALALAAVFLAVPFLGGQRLIAVSQLIGPVTIVLLALSVYLVFFAALAWLYDRYGIPALTFFLLGAILFSFLGYNDNHGIRAEPLTKEPVDLRTAFHEWIAARQPLHGDRPVPVYVVTTQGGGLYAATHAASVLARIQDECPAFAQHIFAISGVSGGSVGAAVFVSAVAKFQPDIAPLPCKSAGTQKYQDYVREFLDRDFLSPILWLWLVPDMLQDAIPYPPIGTYDRARGLEYALEDADESTPPRYASRPFFSALMTTVWRPDQAPPALFLNTARVGTGEQLHVAPIAIETRSVWSQPLLQFYQPRIDFKVSTAAGLSARFPLVAPTARLRAERPDWRDEVEQYDLSLVDGGYADNSGIATIAQLYRDLVRSIVSDKINADLRFIAIGTQKSFLKDYLHTQETLGSPKLSQVLEARPELDPQLAQKSDYGGPLAGLITLNSTREERSAVSRNDFSGTIDLLQLMHPARLPGPHKFWLPFTNNRGDIPLAWFLSKLSRDRIGKLRAGVQADGEERCGLAPVGAQLTRIAYFGDAVDSLVDQSLLRCALGQIRESFRPATDAAAPRAMPPLHQP